MLLQNPTAKCYIFMQSHKINCDYFSVYQHSHWLVLFCTFKLVFVVKHYVNVTSYIRGYSMQSLCFTTCGSQVM